MPVFLTTFLTSKFAKPVGIGFAVLLLIGIVFLLGRCTGSDDDKQVAAQTEQTNRSSEAITNAAQVAIDKIGQQRANEATVDKVVSATVSEINSAPDVDAVRSAVIRGLCNTPSHVNDPACVENHP